MKEVTLNWRGRDILVKYQCVDYGGNQYAIVIDKKGEETWLYKMYFGGRWLWRGGVTNKWPEDLILLLSDFFNEQPIDEAIKPLNLWNK